MAPVTIPTLGKRRPPAGRRAGDDLAEPNRGGAGTFACTLAVSTSNSPSAPEHLLTHDGFVRGLARHLLRDVHAAEDLVQQTWMAALQGLPAEAASGRGWLARVVRRLAGRRARSERRLQRRQRAAARSEQVPSTAEIVAREAQRSEVVRAVLELEDPYRATVLLRFFDNLTPRAIARQLGVPVETVRTRIKRAMAQLRARLDAQRGGDRAAWCALLLPFAGRTSPLVTTAAAVQAAITGVLLMTTKVKLATAVTALAGLLLLALWAVQQPPESQGDASGPAARPGALSAPIESPAVPTDATSEHTAPAERQVVPAPAAPTTGSLLAHVVWGDDKTPAAGVLVEAYRGSGDALFENLRAVSDATGTVQFAELSPGRVWVVVQRGESAWGKQQQIVAGQQLEVTVEVAAGMNARGTVVDGKDKPVAGADVLVTGWTGGEALPLTRTAADGTFSLRAVATHCHIGARAAGHGPSPMRQFTASKGAEVEIRIVLRAAGAALTGLVLDPQDQPVAGAVVQAGTHEQKMHTLADGGTAMGPQAQRVCTDAAGRFAFPSVEAGQLPLAVRGRGLSPWHQDVELQSARPNEYTIRLLPGVTLVGTVHDAAGLPVAKADIEIGDWQDLGHRSVRSDAAGAFRVDGLAAGELAIRVDSDQHGKADTKLQAVAGETLHYDAVLSQGLQFRGRVLDADGKPAPQVMVEASLEQPTRDAHWFGFENTDQDGRFTLKNCAPDQPLRITVRRKSTFPEAHLTHVLPGAEELVIHLPKEAWIYIQGTVLDPDGKALPNVHVSPSMKGGNGSPAETADPVTGEFKYGPYPPGGYSVHLQTDGYPQIRVPFHSVGPDEVWDLGTLQFQRGGTLRVNLVTADAGTMPKRSLPVFDAGGERVDHVDVQDGTGTSRPLPPGSYQLQVAGDGVACMMQTFDVRAGVETRLDVPVQKGIAASIECALPAGADHDSGVSVVVKDRSGAVVLRSMAWAREGTPRLACQLLAGTYRVEAQKDEWRGEAVLEVTAPGPAQAKVQLERR